MSHWKLKERNIPILLFLLFAEILLLFLLTPGLVTFQNLLRITKQLSVTGIASISMAIILISGGIDLSIGSQIALSGVLSGYFMVNLGIPPLLASLFCIILCVLLGFFNGYLVSRIDIHPFITTMAVATVLRGLAKTINFGMPIYGLPKEFLDFSQKTILSIPVLSVLFFLCIIIGTFILQRTYMGKYFYAVGDDERVAALAGLNIRHIKWIVYSLAGFFTGMASILTLSRIGSAQPVSSQNIELDILVAAALAGISLKGGRGRLVNIILSVLIMEILGSVLILLNVQDYFRNIIKGMILLMAISFDSSEGKR